MEKEKPIIDILLVEDNPDDAELTIYAIREGNPGIRLKHLKDGVEALDFIFAKKNDPSWTQNEFSLVLLDLKLPRLDGLEVLRKVKENPETKSLPVVILTSSRERRDIIEAYRLGVNSYVVKPVGFDNYVSTIKILTQYWSQANEKPI